MGTLYCLHYTTLTLGKIKVRNPVPSDIYLFKPWKIMSDLNLPKYIDQSISLRICKGENLEGNIHCQI